MMAFCCIAFAGCLKDLESESVTSETTLQGRVIEAGTGTPAAGVRVLVTNGDRNGEDSRTDANGRFEVAITHEQLHEGYWLLLTADSLYRTTMVEIPVTGYGLKDFDMQTITVDGPELPAVQTDAVSGVSQTSAVGGGTVTDDGRSAIRRRGICWNTAANPTIVNSYVFSGSGSGHFVAAMEGLQQGQTYHVRAFAENSVGIAYGQDVVFTTNNGVPVVTTATVSDVTQHSFTCGGVVTSDSGNPVTARGICYSSTSVQPTINDTHSQDGTGTGSYTSTIAGLQSGTTYYIRAYATNSLGTGYGEVKTVTTF